MSNMIFLVFFIINLSNGQTIVNPTTSDSTGDYYISDIGNNYLKNKEIQCSSNTACYIECDRADSCLQLSVNCGNSPICDIQCNGYYPCQYLKVYISSNATTISCTGEGSCDDLMTLYNNYTYYPSSTTVVNCGRFSLCKEIAIKDAISGEDNYDQLTAERFKIYCDYCSFESRYASNLLTTPTIINETGEYYLDSGSLVDIECTTHKLCYINCNDYNCWYSNINCGPSEECFILCGQNNGCGYNDVTAVGQNKFTYLCDINAPDCSDSGAFNLTNIDTVNITCQETNGCSFIDWHITSVQDLNVNCGFYWSCSYSDWYLTNVDNAVIICNASCRRTDWELNNVRYHKFDCIGDVTNQYALTDKEACNDININGQETSQLDMICVNEYSCQDMTICTDNIFNLDCQGSSSCKPLNLCDATLQSNKTNIIKPPTAEPTTFEPTEYPTTAKPTQYPTTAEPTQHPTTAQPTKYPTTAIPTTSEPTGNPTTAKPTEYPTTGQPTDSPTTSQPTAPTTEPTDKPTDIDIPIDTNGGNRSFALFWMILVITSVNLLQIM